MKQKSKNRNKTLKKKPSLIISLVPQYPFLENLKIDDLVCLVQLSCNIIFFLGTLQASAYVTHDLALTDKFFYFILLCSLTSSLAYKHTKLHNNQQVSYP